MEFPTHLELLNPLLRAMSALGGSGSIDEIDNKVAELENFSDTLRDQLHNPEKSNRNELAYRLAWSRTYLKGYGLLENSSHGVWSLTSKAQDVTKVDPQNVAKVVRALPKKQEDKKFVGKTTDNELVAEEEVWREQLHAILTRTMTPQAFERLAQRVLRESGFVQVEVTGKSGDGGIDGKGIARFHGLLSFHVIFQCKRYQGSVGAGEIRDFRGAMVGRADKGLFLTTGTFSSGAIKEANRDGAPPIDLVDGDDLIGKLRDLGLGVKKTTIERVEVDAAWFEKL
jgi:restriction system protein